MIAMAISDPFAKRLHRLRFDLDLTQDGLADMIGVTKSAISRWENEMQQPSRAIGYTLLHRWPDRFRQRDFYPRRPRNKRSAP